MDTGILRIESHFVFIVVLYLSVILSPLQAVVTLINTKLTVSLPCELQTQIAQWIISLKYSKVPQTQNQWNRNCDLPLLHSLYPIPFFPNGLNTHPILRAPKSQFPSLTFSFHILPLHLTTDVLPKPVTPAFRYVRNMSPLHPCNNSSFYTLIISPLENCIHLFLDWLLLHLFTFTYNSFSTEPLM